MTDLDSKGRKYTTVPGDPGALNPADREDQVVLGASFKCAFASRSVRQTIDSGRKFSGAAYRVWHSVRTKFSTGEHVQIDGHKCEIYYVKADSSGEDERYFDCEVVE